MQFHLNGFRPGDPRQHPAKPGPDKRTPDDVDVLIVGCGPAGLTLAAQLAQFSDIRTMIIDQNPGLLKSGRRTVSPAAQSKCSRRLISANVS